MVLLSPPKLLMVLVIALIVLGPDKLPSMARRVGAAWSEFSRWRAHLESEVRASFPDLPSTTEITKVVRSPLSVLDRLADEHDRATLPRTVGAAPDVSRRRAVTGRDEPGGDRSGTVADRTAPRRARFLPLHTLHADRRPSRPTSSGGAARGGTRRLVDELTPGAPVPCPSR